MGKLTGFGRPRANKLKKDALPELTAFGRPRANKFKTDAYIRNPRSKKWTDRETTALRSGVLKHGLRESRFGPMKRISWTLIKYDPEFSDDLKDRSTVDMKDKWRNISRRGGSADLEPDLEPDPEPDHEPDIHSEGSINELEAHDQAMIAEVLLDGNKTGSFDVFASANNEGMGASYEQRDQLMELTNIVKDIDNSNSASENWLGMFKSDNGCFFQSDKPPDAFDLDGYDANAENNGSDFSALSGCLSMTFE